MKGADKWDGHGPGDVGKSLTSHFFASDHVRLCCGGLCHEFAQAGPCLSQQPSAPELFFSDLRGLLHLLALAAFAWTEPSKHAKACLLFLWVQVPCFE